MKPVQHFTALIQFEDPNSTTLVILPTLLPEPEALLQPQDDIVESRSNTPPCHHSADRMFTQIPADGGTDGEVDAVVSLTQQRYAKNTDLYGVSIANLLDSMPMPAPLDTSREAMEVYLYLIKQTMAMDDITSLVGDAQRTNVSISQNPQHLADQRVSVHQRICMATPLETDVKQDDNISKNVQVKKEPQSISSAIRIKRQAQCQSPYPTCTKHVSNSSKSQNLTIMTDTVENSASVPSRFGYATPEYRQQKVRFKNVNTSWYTYRTLGPLDHPPNLPPNHAELQFNDIFLHINKYQMGKLHGQLRIPKLLKCVKMWVWNSVSLQRISFGEERLMGDGDVLCISFKYNHKIVCPTWITSKSMKRVLKDMHRGI
ncbi:hypothetical protein C8J55DRAFT_558579 [Lentinula edodes]|uniref:Uncharacterized protein n=1 Tax=Lentinula lateritia TaxID=40482 RepID=A0A9W9AQN6_9AGAR|nr:hypothetical protein C8J55DRAFT_558579 [Lentinula edodes]